MEGGTREGGKEEERCRVGMVERKVKREDYGEEE